MNQVNLLGRLTKDVEIRYTQNNTAVASFNLAVRRDKDNTDFINCVAFRKDSRTIAKIYK